MSRLDIGIKPDDVKFPEITKGVTYFVPPPSKSLDLARLAALLKESGYKLRSVRLDLEGTLDPIRKELRIGESGQVFGVADLKQIISGKVRMTAAWMPDASRNKNNTEKVILNVESMSTLK